MRRPPSSTTKSTRTCARWCHSCRLHLPGELAPIEAIRKRLPDMPQIGVFDTAFHRGHAEVIQRLPIPEDLHREGVLSYGYHGISYEFIAERLKEIAPDLARGRVVVAHLGNGCSMCALVDGKSVEATWGFSGLDGLPMGTRPGRLDPGVILYLLQIKGISVAAGRSTSCTTSAGSRGSRASATTFANCSQPGPARAAGARLLLFQLRPPVAALATVMGGIDGLVFTAGIGENAAPVRAEHLLEAGLARPRHRPGRECPARAADLHGQECRHLLRRTDG